jgi:hypothetical protein
MQCEAAASLGHPITEPSDALPAPDEHVAPFPEQPEGHPRGTLCTNTALQCGWDGLWLDKVLPESQEPCGGPCDELDCSEL